MAANVKCAGEARPATEPTPGARTIVAMAGCGWAGERYAMGMLTEQEAALPAWGPEWRAAVHRADAKTRTAKPCPRCGGRIVLIEEGES